PNLVRIVWSRTTLDVCKLKFFNLKEIRMRKLMYASVLTLAAGVMYGQKVEDFVGTWASQAQTRKLELKDGVIVMQETQNNGGGNGGPIVRMYPANGKEVTMTEGVFNGAKAKGEFKNGVLIVDTEMPNGGAKYHDEWTLAADGKSYSATMQITPGANGGGFGG